jgi:hypothetical protein
VPGAQLCKSQKGQRETDKGSKKKVLSAQHRTVWCHSPDSPGCTRQSGARSVQLVALGFLTGYVGYRSPNSPREAPDSPVLQPCNGYLPRRQAPTVTWRTGRSDAPQKRKPGNQGIMCRVLCSYYSLSGAPPDSLVHRRIEGKNYLPNGVPTAPSCLGSIKGTPRRMEQHTKPPLNILRCLDSANARSDHRV